MSDALEIVPVTQPLRGRVAPPGSKSITNRALLLAALAKGTSRLTGALKSDDTARMAEALAAMGVTISEPDATTFVVESSGKLQKPAEPLFLGNAGTATRFLTAAVALVDGDVVVTGDAHMQKRPIQPLVDALRQLGVAAEAPTGCPPVTVHGTGTVPSSAVTLDAGVSSQYLSAVLMLAGGGDHAIDISLAGDNIGARGYVDLTLAGMAHFGARYSQLSAGAWRVEGTGYTARDFHIEPDASAATYLWAASVLTGGNIDLGVPTDEFTQPDAASAAIIAQFPDMPAVIDGSQMQDAVPTMAVLAAFNNQPVRFVGIANLRVKECDRINALSTELNRIQPGLAEEIGDDLIVHSDPSLAGQHLPTPIETYADHRIAMSFALAGLKIGGIVILDPACVGKTYPGYWDALRSLGVQLKNG